MSKQMDVTVGKRVIGPGRPCFVIAEAGVNHNGDIGLARQLIDSAVEAGADAVKFQTFQADYLAVPNAPQAEYQTRNTGIQESQHAMLKRLELSPKSHREILHYCHQQGILFMSTPFDVPSADFLETLDVPVYKISSGEVTNLPFLAHIARKNRPMILSTGMSTLQEVEMAVKFIQSTGNKQIVLLHCVSNYPTDPSDANLRAMQTMSDAFHLPVGFSDHTLGIEVSLAAVAMGACVIEKHITTDKKLQGPDHKASMEPHEFKNLVHGIRIVESSLGHGRKEPAACERATATVARKSLVAARDLSAGTLLKEEMIAAKRPGTGILPTQLPQILGKRLKRSLHLNDFIVMEDLE